MASIISTTTAAVDTFDSILIGLDDIDGPNDTVSKISTTTAAVVWIGSDWNGSVAVMADIFGG